MRDTEENSINGLGELFCVLRPTVCRSAGDPLSQDFAPETAWSLPLSSARLSESAKAKARTRRTTDGLPARSFSLLLADLATQTRKEVTLLPNSPVTPSRQWRSQMNRSAPGSNFRKSTGKGCCHAGDRLDRP